MRPLTSVFPIRAPRTTFAGLPQPRPFIPGGGKLSDRKRRYKNPATGPYIVTPPVAGLATAYFFYSGSMGDGMRWWFADDMPADMDAPRINHTGWYANDGFDTVRGVVSALPSGRGFLAGWSMGDGMAGEFSRARYYDVNDAVYAADELARRTADDMNTANDED